MFAIHQHVFWSALIHAHMRDARSPIDSIDPEAPVRFTMGHRDSFMLADDISNLLGSQASLDGGAPPLLLRSSKPCAFRLQRATLRKPSACLLRPEGCPVCTTRDGACILT